MDCAFFFLHPIIILFLCAPKFTYCSFYGSHYSICLRRVKYLAISHADSCNNNCAPFHLQLP